MKHKLFLLLDWTFCAEIQMIRDKRVFCDHELWRKRGFGEGPHNIVNIYYIADRLVALCIRRF
jgi:hypothetical protein